MRILKEAKTDEHSFDWKKSRNFLDMFESKERVDESLLTEDKYTELLPGTCFKLTSKPAVYQILGSTSEPLSNPIRFRAFGHESGNVWSTSQKYLQQLIDSGDVEILSKDQIDSQFSY